MMVRMTVIAAALMLAVLVPQAQASSAVGYNLRVPFTDEFDSCAGERVLVSGVQRIVGRSMEDSGGHFHFGFTRHTQGTGVGEVSGGQYLLIDSMARAELVSDTDGGVTTFTEEYHSVFIRKGEGVPGDDLVARMFTHYTYNANGTLTADVEIVEVVCR